MNKQELGDYGEKLAIQYVENMRIYYITQEFCY